MGMGRHDRPGMQPVTLPGKEVQRVLDHAGKVCIGQPGFAFSGVKISFQPLEMLYVGFRLWQVCQFLSPLRH